MQTNTSETENEGGDGKNRTQTGHKRQGKAGKTEVAFWRTKVRPRTIRGEATRLLYARLFDGTREARVCLDTSNKDIAAKKARDLWVRMQALGGLAALIRELNPAPDPTPALLATVGDLLRAARDVAVPTRMRPRSFAGCEAALRKIVAGIAGIEGDTSRFDYRTGGAARWRASVDALSLDVLSPDAIDRWRSAFIRSAGDDLAARESRTISASSYIRCARVFFGRKLTEKIRERISMPATSPFETADKLEESVRPFVPEVDPRMLYAAAWAELRGREDVLVAFCLAITGGLRRSEIDLLPWKHCNLVSGTVAIKTTAHFQTKSKQSNRVITLPPDVVELLAGRRAAMPAAEFVLLGSGPKRVTRSNNYRAHCWHALADWLRSHGITSRCPIHTLRKAAGSLCNAQLGLEGTRRFLGHRDIATTTKSYVHIAPVAVNIAQPRTP